MEFNKKYLYVFVWLFHVACVHAKNLCIMPYCEDCMRTVIMPYCEDCSDASKDEFFLRLQETVGRVVSGDLLVVMGDMNARVGDDTSIWGEVLGRYGEEVCNENGRRLLQFCNEYNLWISNTWFPHKRIHKYTWECRGRGLRSLIDYFLVGKEARKQVMDVKAVRGAEIGSDHYLVLMKIKLKARRVKNSSQVRGRQKIKIRNLKDDMVRREYQAVIAELYEEARAGGCASGKDVELAWKELKEGIVGAATKVCGTMRGRSGQAKRTRWWNEEVKSAVQKKKVLYKRLLDTGNVEARQRYNEAKLEARKLVRKAKNDEWVQFGKEMEKDAKGNQPRFWARVNGNRMTKESMTRINGKNGQVLSEGAEVIGRWKEHFEELFHEVGEPLSDTQCSEAMQEDDMGIMKEEVRNGVKRLKMRKAPGICGILPEMLKAGVKW